MAKRRKFLKIAGAGSIVGLAGCSGGGGGDGSDGSSGSDGSDGSDGMDSEDGGDSESEPSMTFGGDGTVDVGLSPSVPQEDLEVQYSPLMDHLGEYLRENFDVSEDLSVEGNVGSNYSAVILGSPVYHGSYSSALKNALDYCGFDELEETTVGLLCVAGGAFPTTTLDHLRSVSRALNAWVLPHQVAIPRARNCFEGDELVDDDVRERVETLGRRTVEYATIEPDPRTLESTQNVGADD